MSYLLSIDFDYQSLHSCGRDRDLTDWYRLKQSLLVDISGVMPPMPPRRRKYNIDVCEEEKTASKRFKTSIMSSDRSVLLTYSSIVVFTRRIKCHIQ